MNGQGVAQKYVLFFDGTGAAAATTQLETNIFRLNRTFMYGGKTSLYFAGVGTRRDYMSLATGAGLDEIIREAYINLSSNYQPGDELYFFGWSRGAIAARAVAAMLSRPGLIGCDGLDLYPTVWKWFCLDKTLPGNQREAEAAWKDIEQHVYRGDDAPRIKFLGVFDSVVGTYWATLRRFFLRLHFETLILDDRIDYAFQLLSIDDNRNPSYSPLLWEKPSHNKHSFDQVWMPGVHADLGGNSGATFLNTVAFLTMLGVAQKRCNFHFCEWDKNRIDDATKALKENHSVEISSERGELYNPNRALLWGKRYIGDSKYKSQQLHPITKLLLNKPVLMRGRKKRYLPPNLNYEVLHLPEFNIPYYHELICDATKRAVACTPGTR
jgi:uncharacterized protein (DUF2235 family)